MPRVVLFIAVQNDTFSAAVRTCSVTGYTVMQSRLWVHRMQNFGV